MSDYKILKAGVWGVIAVSVLCGHGSEAMSKERPDDLLTRLVKARRVRLELDKVAAPSAAKAPAAELAKFQEESPSDVGGSPVIEYLQMRAEYLAGDKERAGRGFRRLASRPAVAPEALLGLIELYGDKNAPRIAVENAMARLLPVSQWGGLADGRKSELTVDNHRPIIPSAQRDKMVRVAQAFHEMELWNRAAGAYRDALYSVDHRHGPPWIAETTGRDRSWLSEMASPLWLQLAEVERRSGNSALGAEYLAKGVIWGSAESVEEAGRLLKAWTAPTATRGSTGKPEKDKLQRIAALYVEMNLHPRAIELLTSFSTTVGGAGLERRRAYEQQWVELLKKYKCLVRGKLFVLGKEVEERIAAPELPVPYPCQPETVKAVAGDVARMAIE